MRPFSSATPCPGTLPYQYSTQPAPHPYGRPYHPVLYPSHEDTTANIEYTTEFNATSRGAIPKRPPVGQRQKTWDPSRDIYHDRETSNAVPIRMEEHNQQRRESALTSFRSRAPRRSSILAQPTATRTVRELPHDVKQDDHKPSRRRVSTLLADREAASDSRISSQMERKGGLRPHNDSQLRKDPRRHTIYIPSEDTTIMTIHPGMRSKSRRTREPSPDLGLDLVTLSEEDEAPIQSLEPVQQPKPKPKKMPRRSLMVAPKKGPLQSSSRPVQDVTFVGSTVPKANGKENVPPGKMFDLHLPRVENKAINQNDGPSHNTSRRTQQKLHSPKKAPKTQTIHSQPEVATKRTHLEDYGDVTRKKRTKANPVPVESLTRLESCEPAPRNSSPQRLSKKPQHVTSSRLSMSFMLQKAKAQSKYPLLTEDLAQPELYEDHWLEHQEISLSELINSLFAKAEEPQEFKGHSDLRRELLTLYHDPAIPLLHRRLQASMMYGALSISKDHIAQVLRLRDDLGQRRKYLKLLVDSYEPSILKAGVEAIVGRECTPASLASRASERCSYSEKQSDRSERKSLEAFLEAFFIRHEDAVRIRSDVGSIKSIARGGHSGSDDTGTQQWAWRRIVLRSLLLVMLLDKAKTSSHVQGCLFRSTSPHKSSVSVLKALGNMLLPSVGDVVRPLTHLDYTLNVIQHGLEEHTCQIKNLATDLRDGVVLTRMVELLLCYPRALPAQRNQPHTTISISLPDGTAFSAPDSSTQDDKMSKRRIWVLSQHLKYPCHSRAQRLFNVQLALNAMETVTGTNSQFLSSIRADDIVDGHREKTLSLLWGFVAQWGLERLIDWRLVSAESARLQDVFRRSQLSKNGDPPKESDVDVSGRLSTSVDGEEGMTAAAEQLLLWAQNVARLHGLRVSNLTTSFADSKVFDAIVSEYAQYILSPCPASEGTGTLASRLQCLGCSSAFVSLLAPERSSTLAIPSQKQTAATLLFLASRLLPLAVAHNAASTIQRAYRARLRRQESSRRIVLMRLASHCATVVQARERIIGSAVIIQRAWRACIDRRVSRLVGAVVRIQSVYRGYAVRRERSRDKLTKMKRRIGW